MIIGVDLDNTTVCYDELFLKVAREWNLIARDLPSTKESVRDYLRQTGLEDAWTELQGYVYGTCMEQAVPFPGTYEFFMDCTQHKIPVCIISQRTRYPVLGKPYDLHQSASSWLKNHGFYDTEKTGLSARNVYFELAAEEKMNRILKAQCDYFIDDLPEFLLNPGFPPHVTKILFDPHNTHLSRDNLSRAASWKSIQEIILQGQILHHA